MTHHADDDFEEPPHLRLLRRLVTGLIVVLILGVLAIAAAIVIRVGFGVGEGGSEEAPGGPVRAERFALPSGMDIVAVGRGAGTVLFVLRGSDGKERLYTFDDRTGKPTGESAIARAK